MKWYLDNHVNFVSNAVNPLNYPQYHPIEKYWSIVKRVLKKNGGVVKNVKGMRKKRDQFTATVDQKTVQRLIKKHVRNFIQNSGVLPITQTSNEPESESIARNDFWVTSNYE